MKWIYKKSFKECNLHLLIHHSIEFVFVIKFSYQNDAIIRVWSYLHMQNVANYVGGSRL